MPMSGAAITTRPLREHELNEADRIVRLAFGTFLCLPDPLAAMGDTDLARTRWRADPSSVIAAEVNGKLAGSNFVTNWGSFGFFGPLTVRPDLWDRGVARHLMGPTMALFERWGARHAGLFTFSNSAKHLALYERFGFSPRFLTSIMSRHVTGSPNAPRWTGYSSTPEGDRESYLAGCRALTDTIYPGLDLTREIRAVAEQDLGETVLLLDGSGLDGFAVCHCGPGTEAGSSACYVKFGAARPGPGATERFERLLDACEALAAARGLERLDAGVNTGRREAYRQMRTSGFRVNFIGVAMQRPDEPGYNRPDAYVIDDWR